jgi:uncharacterized protein YcfL
MKTRILLAVLLVLVALQGLGLTALADGPVGTWASGIQIQNQSSTNAANVTIEFYWAENSGNASTTPAKVHTLTIPKGESVSLYVPTQIPGLPDNFVGSAVVSADQPVAAILNTQRVSTGGDADPKRMGSATGVLTPATKLYAPYLRKAYYGRNSYIAVQNTTGSTVNVTVTYYDHTGVQVDTDTKALTAYSSNIFYQDQNADLPADFHGSAIVEGTGNIAVVVNNANAGTNVSTAGFESYNGLVPQDATKVYMPKLTVNYSKYQSSFTVQNTGTAAAHMTFTFTAGANTWTKASGAISPGSAWGVYLATAGASGIPADTVANGAGVVTSDQPIVGIVTETQPDRGYSVVWNAIGEGTASDTVLFPKFDRRYYDYNGGIQIQNVGTTNTTLVATFSKTGMPGPVQVTSGTLVPGASQMWYSETIPGLPDNFNGSVVVVSQSGSDIAGVYTSSNSNRTIGDTYVAYNGIQR